MTLLHVLSVLGVMAILIGVGAVCWVSFIGRPAGDT